MISQQFVILKYSVLEKSFSSVLSMVQIWLLTTFLATIFQGGGNMVVSANGRANGYCLSGTGTNGHYPNGHVTSFTTGRARQDIDKEIPVSYSVYIGNNSHCELPRLLKLVTIK